MWVKLSHSAGTTYYPQYEGQFATEAEYESDRNQHYEGINKKLDECWEKLEELGYHEANRKVNKPSRINFDRANEITNASSRVGSDNSMQ